MATTTRLLNLLSLLQTRRDWPGALLAERLDISHRTVRRDIDRLREMGYRIAATMGPDGGYRLDAGSELPPLLFDDDQVIALAVALQAATLTGVGIEEDAVRALTTVRQVMPSRLRHRLDALSFTTISAGSGDADSVSPEVLVAISAAVRGREVFRFDYSNDHSTDNSEITPPRRVEPHHLVTSKRRWYLVAWDLARDDWRIFRADRITPRTPNGPRFTPKEIPGGDVSEYVSARFKGSEHINNWPCHGKVVLHRPASYVLPFVGEGIVEDLGPEQCSLEAGSWSWMALAASFNRFDTDIDVVGPAELTHAFAQLAARNAATAES
ncbi:putative DNA-binding transcriptional regulator YafY [Rhodococcus sp. OAS809]|uniref:helix-turn-helix transcriptional regulator n=1 Tax=Rhodococcus sp. OAS809 TaxID=2663874 RepID=UPI00178BB287